MSGNKKEKKTTKKKRKNILKGILVVFIIFMVITLGITTYFFQKYGGFVGEVVKIVKDVKNEVIKVEDSITVLVLGLDFGDLEQVENKDIKRTDTIMLAHFNPNTDECQIVSIPRDTQITYKNKKWKINSAYPLGGEKLLKQLMKDMLGVNVDYVVKVDYNGFRQVIDAIGGVEMYIDQDMFYDDWEQDLHINFKAGDTVQLDGKKAEEFFRWRQNNDGTGLPNGDLDRIKNQQKLMGKVMDKIMSPSTIWKIDSLAKAIEENVDTDLDLKTIVSYGLEFLELDKANVEMSTLVGESVYKDNLWYFMYDKEENAELIKKLKDNSKNKQSNDLKDILREDVKIKVLNCCNINGLASEVKSDLLEIGYDKVEIDNGLDIEKTKILVKENKYKTLMNNDLVVKNIEVGIDKKYNHNDEYDIVILLGKDYLKIGAK
ncbi:LCP family protein [Clostridium tarantellae]|uniref:LytR family transcriptional regulator n=1 Tax=Clostridium tarantellae TaxID=39493 RepID=A0A6I1MG13_9CLOT|nr:LCP family protein [Clostridium tarantellae]MPQ42476.1 LytR family transcriptional regulator [Clostridium tarantellae]